MSHSDTSDSLEYMDLLDSEESSDADTLETGETRRVEEEVEEEESGGAGNREARFDTNLPTTHGYLGRLENIPGHTLFENGETIRLLAIQTKTMVFPGFVLPLVVTDNVEKMIMRNFLNHKNMFVWVWLDESENRLYPYGVTMEVTESSIQADSFNFKSIGRQRCEILLDLEIKHLSTQLSYLSVKILAERNILSPVQNTQLLGRSMSCGYMQERFNCRKRRFHLAQYPHAGWVYDLNENDFYIKKIHEKLSAYFEKEFIPKDPVLLSYWFIQNFMLTDEERLKLLALNTALERLKLEWEFLQLERNLCCYNCHVRVTHQSNIFAMSKDGTQNNYCNPGGVVFELVTVSKAKHFTLVGKSSHEFSWFPGYSWTIMQCVICRNHLGWLFKSKTSIPAHFFGLAKGGFNVQIISPRETQNNDL